MFHKTGKDGGGDRLPNQTENERWFWKENVKSYWPHPKELFIFISCSILLMSRFVAILPLGERTSTFIKRSPSECGGCYAGAVTHIMGDGISFHLCCSAGSNSNLELNFLLKNIAFHVECQLLKCSVPCLTSH